MKHSATTVNDAYPDLCAIIEFNATTHATSITDQGMKASSTAMCMLTRDHAFRWSARPQRVGAWAALAWARELGPRQAANWANSSFCRSGAAAVAQPTLYPGPIHCGFASSQISLRIHRRPRDQLLFSMPLPLHSSRHMLVS